MHKAFFTLDHSPSILNEDDAPTGTITDPTSYYLHLSHTSSESIDHLTASSQSSLSKPFHAFFATRSRVLKVSGVCGITSLTLLTLNIQLYNLPAMAESLLYHLFHPHNVPPSCHFTATVPNWHNFTHRTLTSSLQVRFPFPYQCGSCDVNLHHNEMVFGPSFGLMKRCVISSPHLMFPFATIKSWNDEILNGFPFMVLAVVTCRIREPRPQDPGTLPRSTRRFSAWNPRLGHPVLCFSSIFIYPFYFIYQATDLTMLNNRLPSPSRFLAVHSLLLPP